MTPIVKRLINFSFLFLLFNQLLPGQGMEDSLVNLIQRSSEDSVRIQLYQKLAWELKYSEPNKSHAYLDTALTIANRDASTKILADVLYYKAIIFYLTDDYENAILNSNEALSHYLSINQEYGMASIYNLLGLINNRIGDYETAITNYHQSLKLAEKGDNLYAISNPYHNIALIYKDLEDYKQSLEYAQKALELRMPIGDSTYIGQSFQTIGALYYHLTDYEKAESYLQKALTISESANDINSLAITYLNLGLLYRDQGKLEESEQLFYQSIDLCESLEAHEDLVNSLVNLSGVYLLNGNFEKAENSARQARKIAIEYNLLPSLKEAMEVLTDALEARKNYKEAFYDSRELLDVSDSLLNSEKSQQITNLEIKYQVSQKEQQINLQQAQISEQQAKNQLNQLIIAGLTLFLVLAIIILILLRSRSRKKEQLLLQEGELKLKEAEVEFSIRSQERERARFAKDLHDGFGQMISILNLNLKSLENADADRHEIFENSSEVLDEMYKELKGICFDLMPQTLIHYGLPAAIREFADRINKSGQIMVETDFFGMENRLTDVQEISLYRIIQEWVNNVLKYGQANHVTVQLTKEESALSLLIEDDGPGFDAKLLESGKGNGWRNIRSRVNLIKGELSLDTIPGRQGNTLIVDYEMTDQSFRDRPSQRLFEANV